MASINPAPSSAGTSSRAPQINIKILSQLPDPHKVILFDHVSTSQTILDLKTMIMNHLPQRPPPAAQRLIHRGHVLAPDTETLGSILLTGSSAAMTDGLLYVLHVVIREAAMAASPIRANQPAGVPLQAPVGQLAPFTQPNGVHSSIPPNTADTTNGPFHTQPVANMTSTIHQPPPAPALAHFQQHALNVAMHQQEILRAQIHQQHQQHLRQLQQQQPHLQAPHLQFSHSFNMPGASLPGSNGAQQANIGPQPAMPPPSATQPGAQPGPGFIHVARPPQFPYVAHPAPRPQNPRGSSQGDQSGSGATSDNTNENEVDHEPNLPLPPSSTTIYNEAGAPQTFQSPVIPPGAQWSATWQVGAPVQQHFIHGQVGTASGSVHNLGRPNQVWVQGPTIRLDPSTNLPRTVSPSQQTNLSTTAPGGETVHGLRATNASRSSSSSTVAYLLQSPQGPTALVLTPEGRFSSSATQPLNPFPHFSPFSSSHLLPMMQLNPNTLPVSHIQGYNTINIRPSPSLSNRTGSSLASTAIGRTGSGQLNNHGLEQPANNQHAQNDLNFQPQQRQPPYQPLQADQLHQQQNVPQGQDPPVPAQLQQLREENRADDLAQVVRPAFRAVWILIRLFGFIWFFTSGSSSRRFIVLVSVAICIWIAQSGILGNRLNRLRQYWEELIGVPINNNNNDGDRVLVEAADRANNNNNNVNNNTAVQARPANGRALAGNDVNNNAASPRDRDTLGLEHSRPHRTRDPVERENRRIRRRLERGQLDPQEAAEHILRGRQQADRAWWRQRTRPFERATALFLASLYPGVGERHVAAQERLDREAAAAAAARERDADEEEQNENEGDALDDEQDHEQAHDQLSTQVHARSPGADEEHQRKKEKDSPAPNATMASSSAVAVHDRKEGTSLARRRRLGDEDDADKDEEEEDDNQTSGAGPSSSSWAHRVSHAGHS